VTDDFDKFVDQILRAESPEEHDDRVKQERKDAADAARSWYKKANSVPRKLWVCKQCSAVVVDRDKHSINHFLHDS
jgi:rubrerythrin